MKHINLNSVKIHMCTVQQSINEQIYKPKPSATKVPKETPIISNHNLPFPSFSMVLWCLTVCLMCSPRLNVVDSHGSSSCSQLLSFGLTRGKLSKHSSITALRCQNCKASTTFSSLVCVAFPKVISNRHDAGYQYRTAISQGMLTCFLKGHTPMACHGCMT